MGLFVSLQVLVLTKNCDRATLVGSATGLEDSSVL
jgi:hypothetical protein